MAVATCENCGSDDVVQDAESSSGRNKIAIRCLDDEPGQQSLHELLAPELQAGSELVGIG
jgi:hypothetical protein